MPLHDLHHGIAVLPVKLMQAIDRHVEQIAIYLRRRRCQRSARGLLRIQRRRKEQKSNKETHTPNLALPVVLFAVLYGAVSQTGL